MHQQDSRTDLGVIKIHRNVIASIASIAALDIDGVKSVGRPHATGVFELLLGKCRPLAIRVEIDKRDEVCVNIPLVIKFGYNIPEVSAKVQENVRNALEKMTNITIKDIDINVQGIESEVTR